MAASTGLHECGVEMSEMSSAKRSKKRNMSGCEWICRVTHSPSSRPCSHTEDHGGSEPCGMSNRGEVNGGVQVLLGNIVIFGDDRRNAQRDSAKDMVKYLPLFSCFVVS